MFEHTKYVTESLHCNEKVAVVCVMYIHSVKCTDVTIRLKHSRDSEKKKQTLKQKGI